MNTVKSIQPSKKVNMKYLVKYQSRPE